MRFCFEISTVRLRNILQNDECGVGLDTRYL
jgi:hypothetical protein